MFSSLNVCVCVCVFAHARECIVYVLDTDIVIRVFKLQMNFYVHFRINILGKGMNSLKRPRVVPLLSYEDGFGIKQSTNVNMPLKQRNQINTFFSFSKQSDNVMQEN